MEESNWQNDWGMDTKPAENMSREEYFQFLLKKFTREVRKAHQEKYNMDRAEKTAALCLDAQKELSEFMSEAELLAKEKKTEAEAVAAERYFFYKSSSETKITDVALNRMVDKDDEVKAAKKEQYKAEADYNKWKSLLGTLKDGHIFFRGVSRGKNEF